MSGGIYLHNCLLYLQFHIYIMMKIARILKVLLTLALIIWSCNSSDDEWKLAVINLKCENLESPIAIDKKAPLLSWNLESGLRAQMQSAYRIVVSENKESLDNDIGEYWDTGIVNSDESINIGYDGKVLNSRDVLYWKVKVWSAAGKESSWSEISKWEMSFLEEDDWEAEWIGLGEDEAPLSTRTYPAPYFRKAFDIRKKIKNAKVYVSGLGYYELYLNGLKVGDHALAPAQTNYDIRALPKLLYHYDDQSTTRTFYNTFDVTGQLKSDKNVVGMTLGNGWYNQRDRTVEGDLWYATPRLIFQMEIEYHDGEKEVIVSNDDWRVATGPMLHDGIFTGEIYDARLELEGWNTHAFDDSKWKKAQVVRAPTGKLESQLAPPDKVVRTFKPAAIHKTQDGRWIIDAGEMISGWIRLKINEKSGKEITMRFIEELGSSYGQRDIYIAKGNREEMYEPRFTWHAFRTIEIKGLTRELTKDDLDIIVVNTDVTPAGSFHCSNELYNKIQENYIRTQLGNFHGSISSDCPHRERLGYTGDGSILVESSIYNFDMTNFYQKWTNDMDDARNKSTGYVPHTAPYGGGGGGPAWGSAYIITPWFYYLYYGDERILEEHYSGMKHWVEYLGTRTDENGIVVREEPNGWCLGDWATPGKIEIPPSYVNTCYYYYVSTLMSKISTVLNLAEDAEYFQGLAHEIKGIINTHFFDKDTKQYWEGRQGSNVIALAFDIVPEKYQMDVLNNLVMNIHKNKGHLDTGILATPLLLEVLTRYRREGLAFSIMNQRDFPGFGDYILGKGATTLWENWNGNSSHSHPMYGSVIRWFYQAIAGIYPDENKPGFKHTIIKPALAGDLEFASADYNSLYGKISSSWKLEDGNFYLDLEIPTNTTATVYLPSPDYTKVTEGGNSIKSAAGIKYIKSENDRVIFALGSGKYSFVSENVAAQIQQVRTSTPMITPKDSIFLKPGKASITITSATEGADIYYTTDGSIPSQKSIPYLESISLEDDAIIKAVALKDGYLPGYIKTENIKFVDPKIHGINYTVYEGEWKERPDLNNITEVSSGRQYDFDVTKIKKREDYVVIVFEGFIRVNQPGDFNFYSSANDGSWLYIDNKLVVDNTLGNHTGKENSIIRLQQGKYPIKVIYYENSGTESLNVLMKGPGMDAQPIPPINLFLN